MKKIFISLILILFLTGCDAEYKVIIKSNSVQEFLTVNNFKNTLDIDFNKFYVPIDYEIDDYEFFTSKIEDVQYYNLNKKKDLLKLEYEFNTDNFSNSMLLNQCFEKVVFTKDDYEVLLKTTGDFLCFENFEQFNKLSISIESDYKLLNTNADKVEKHKYTWYINKENFSDKTIILRLDTTIEDLTLLEKISRGDYMNIFTLSLVIGVIGFIIYKLLKKYSQKRDEI